MANYYNIQPIATAVAGVLALSEPVTAPIVVGGALALIGVTIVRRNTLLRPSRSDEESEGQLEAPTEQQLAVGR